MSTPPSAPAPIVTSTPYNKGSQSHLSHASEHTQTEYAPYLQEDLRLEKTISMAEFLELVLCIPRDQASGQVKGPNAAKMAKSTEFKDLLATYTDWKSHGSDETSLYAPFIALANHCIGKDATVQFCRDDPTLINGSDAGRKPDVLSVWLAALQLGGRNNVFDGPDTDSAFHWMEVLGFWEFKFSPKRGDISAPAKAVNKPRSQDKVTKVATPTPPTRTSARKAALAVQSGPVSGPPVDVRASQPRASKTVEKETPAPAPRVQCASYALEMLSYSGLRSHVIGGLITNNVIQLLYYDRSIIVKSEEMDFKANPTLFITMLKRIASLSDSQWGFHRLTQPRLKQIYLKGVLTSPFGNSTLTLNDQRKLHLGETIFQAHGIIGRGTCVSRATLDGQNVVVKWSWPAKSRMAEAAFVRRATEKATGNSAWVLNHLPKIIYEEEQELDADSPQRRLSEHLGDEYEDRVFRLVVQEELFPITSLTTAEELSQAFHGIFKCYRWLYENIDLMHRDISLNNLMFRRIDGKVYGVLNDFDLAVIKTDMPLSTSNHRTGTAPYMALDLLKPNHPPPHIVRFDLESLYYVFAYIVCQYHDGKKIDNPPFEEWNHLSPRGLYKEKYTFIHGSLNVQQTPQFTTLKNATVLLHIMFWHAYRAREDSNTDPEAALLMSRLYQTPLPLPVDDETLGNRVTFDAFERILKETLPSLAKCP
ncbi:hypothetical protein C8R46DRAFT_658699 [Mycena filopes]|nr:hypothetical protein C8R46DRAFT_658699 [Mycena filopes]